MRNWLKGLDHSGLAVLLGLMIVLGLLLYPFVAWVFTPYQVYGIPTVEPPPHCTRPAGFAQLEVPIQPRIEYVRYVGNPLPLNMSAAVFAIPFSIDLVFNNGECVQATATGTGNPALDGQVNAVCASWVENLRYVFPINARLRVTVFPGGQYRLEWIDIDPASFPSCVSGMVCYTVSRFPQWSIHVVPIGGVLVSVNFSPSASATYSAVANNCRNCLNVGPGFNI